MLRLRTALLPFLLLLTAASPAELAQWRDQAARVTITRDNWGIAHVRGRSDADAVFGMIYAQAEDDFNRIETNYLTNLGRLAEAEGEKAIWSDLRMRLFLRGDDLRARYAASPLWLKRLMDSWAAGLNFYLATHPQVKPKVLTRFEPWMALSFTEGSIGADFERVPLGPLEAFYAKRGAFAEARAPEREPTGSNGIAIAPKLTGAGKSLLLINPHTSFFFRSELQMTSDEGLNAYGAATWGQFFIYQGFNERLGWMHTTSGLDSVDEFAERVIERGGRRFYRYGTELRPVETSNVTIAYRTADGGRATRSFEVYRTHHGPIVAEKNGRWIAFALMHRPVEALSQSFLRTKARDLPDYLKVMELKANSSNNTIYADAKGNIAYLHPQFIPRRNDRFDYTRPVDGSDPATDWRGIHETAEAPRLVNPPNGWVQNTNNWPYSAAGADSPPERAFPRYMDSFGENPRGLHAVKLLAGSSGWSLDGLNAAAYSPEQPGFAQLLPGLVEAWDRLPASDRRKAALREPIAVLRGWDTRWSEASVANTLANFWGEEVWKLTTSPEWDDGLPVYRRLQRVSGRQKLDTFAAALARLRREFGRWQVPWGEVNRFQRISPAIQHPFDDSAPSIPVGFSSARWGSLASFGAAPKPGTRKWYGTGGNSFVAVVEFGPRVRAKAVTAGGASGDPASPHFNDQAQRYATGALREVHFHPDQIRAHTARRYRPGERR